MVEQQHSKSKRSSKKWLDIAILFIALAVFLLLNILSAFVFERFDLTEEKRYTLSEATRSELENLEDAVFVRVYLDGNLPTEFRELRDATQEMLDEFRAFAGDNLQYEFINPGASTDEKERIEVYKELTRQGLQFSNIRVRTGDQLSEQIIFPGAIVTYQGRETPLQLLKSQTGATEQEMISTSIQQLEYELMSSIKKVSVSTKQRIAFIDGHSELDTLETADARRALSEFYDVSRVTINEKLNALKEFRAIIIAQPDSAYSEKDKFIIDQFIMNGGRVLWLIDPVFARMDSLRNANIFLAHALNHNLDDMLFKYGARLNSDLIMDLEAVPLPIVTGMIGNQTKQEMFTWYYQPLVSGSPLSPISNGLDRLLTEFVSTIDPIDAEGITHTTLLTSSDRARKVNAPSRVSLNILREQPKYEMFNSGPFAVGMLLEGSFSSVFTNRIPKRILDNDSIGFKEKSIATKMIVVSDADIIKNPVNRADNKYFALGYYRFTKMRYGNREFILNAMNYLCDDSGLLTVRSKEIKTRLLDQTKVDKERFFWQGLNIGFPIFIILAMGIGMTWWRKRKYDK